MDTIGVVWERTKIDSISRQQRLLYFYYFFLKMQNKEESVIREEYFSLLHATSNWFTYYHEYFANETIDDQAELGMVCDCVVKGNNETIKNQVNRIWKKVKAAFRKEIECEKQLRSTLNKKAEEHPIVSKIIILVLTGILLGLVEDCIHDVILKKSEDRNNRITNIYVKENSDIKRVYYEGETITIEDLDGNVQIIQNGNSKR